MIKKTPLAFCRTTLFTGALLFAATNLTLAAEYVSVAKDDVNVRTEPTTNSPVYMELFQGYPLKVEEKKGDWYKISDFEKDSGWIYAPLVSNKKTVIVTAGKSANMRSGPSTSDKVVANVERGVVLEVVSRKGNWVKVHHSGEVEGWIYAPLLWP